VIQGDGFQVNPLLTEDEASDSQRLVLHAQVNSLRSLGEISLATLALDEPAGTQLQLTLSGTQRHNVQTGQQISVSMDCRWIHVMPVRR
jgi:molybdate transport system ATP-binding protein